MTLSVCIVTYNSEATIADAISSVIGQCDDESSEIIVVDNHSSDRTAELVAREWPAVHLITSQRNLGFARGMNLALRRARGQYLLLLNPDLRLMPGAIRLMIQTLRELPHAAAVSATLLSSDMKPQASVGAQPGLVSEFLSAAGIGYLLRSVDPDGRVVGLLASSPLHRLVGHSVKTYLESSQLGPAVREVSLINGTCVLVNREALRDVGMLDERFFLYAEDADWSRRCTAHGWRLYIVRDAQAVHHGQWSFTRRFGLLSPIRHYSSVQLAYKHHSRGYGRLVRGALTLGFLARLVLLTMLAVTDRQVRGQYLDSVKQILDTLARVAFYHPTFSALLFDPDRPTIAIDSCDEATRSDEQAILRHPVRVALDAGAKVLLFSSKPSCAQETTEVVTFDHAPLDRYCLLWALLRPRFWIWAIRVSLLLADAQRLILDSNTCLCRGLEANHRQKCMAILARVAGVTVEQWPTQIELRPDPPR